MTENWVANMESLRSTVLITKLRHKEVKLEPVLSFKNAITRDVYDDFARDFENMDFKGSTKPFKDYVSHFKNMKIDESRVAKVVNGRITAMAIHPMQEKIIVSVGDNLGAVGFWHVFLNGNIMFDLSLFKYPLQK
ncbi:UNVERIFIED_CONTAM: wdr76 [Trichonephila clavipes]